MNKEVLGRLLSNDQRYRRLLDQMRDLIRIRQCSIRTEQAHLQRIRRYILFRHTRHALGLCRSGKRPIGAWAEHPPAGVLTVKFHRPANEGEAGTSRFRRNTEC